MSNDSYIGDGVYVSFDGWMIWIAANHHENKVVALEPAVFEKLVEYGNKIFNAKTTRETEPEHASGSDDNPPQGHSS